MDAKVDPEAKAGDWQWAHVVGLDSEVRADYWPPSRRIHVKGKVGWLDEGGFGATPPCQYDSFVRWELYKEPAPPEPAPPECVRWKLEWRNGHLNAKIGPNTFMLALFMPSFEQDGYRFYVWVYHLPDGRVIVRPGGRLPIYWSDNFRRWCNDPMLDSDCRAIWPTEVEMVRVPKETT